MDDIPSMEELAVAKNAEIAEWAKVPVAGLGVDATASLAVTVREWAKSVGG